MYASIVTTQPDIAGLDTPVLVLPYHSHTGLPYDDDAHYIRRTHEGAGHDSGTFDFMYDRANHRIAFASYGAASPGDSYYAHPFPFFSASTAQSLVRSTRGVAINTNFQPTLIFFPPNQRLSDTRSPLNWTGGGYDPALPMWLVQGADGTAYFAGIDQHVYTSGDLPIAPGGQQ